MVRSPEPVRPSQLSIIEGMERPVGPIPPSVCTGNNADLIAAVAPLYLTGSVLDVTYGRGKWWDRFTPKPFTFHDKELDGTDFRALPYEDGQFDAVCFDPPYVASGGPSSAAIQGDIQGDYGIGYRRVGGCASLYALILDGLAESCRVSSGWVLVKCMEFAGGGSEFSDVPTMVTNRARDLGWKKHDQVVHFTGPGPGGHNITKIKRCRRVHSYLLVFARAKAKVA